MQKCVSWMFSYHFAMRKTSDVSLFSVCVLIISLEEHLAKCQNNLSVYALL